MFFLREERRMLGGLWMRDGGNPKSGIYIHINLRVPYVSYVERVWQIYECEYQYFCHFRK